MNITIKEQRDLRSFEYRWPDSREHFDRGFEGLVEAEGRRHRFRYGISTRHVYGRERAHTVTWIDGTPVVEGVAEDAFDTSHSLVSAIKGPDGKLVRSPDVLPNGYERFAIVPHAEAIRAPRTRRALAVRIGIEDVASWLALALLRLEQRARRDEGPPVMREERPEPSPISVPAALETVASVLDKRAVAEGLLSYAASYAPLEGDSLPPLTPDVDADALVRNDPFAFLLAVIFDQGVPYGRAWVAPLELRRRIGPFDPDRLLADPDAVRTAVQQPPALHRFINKMPRWLLAAARRVLDDYGGDASAIWSDSPTAQELQRRFAAFDGIAQKKAAMAVELLERHLGVPITMMEGSDIAYDVHVRRVFMRSGLADRDDPMEMIAVARELHPQRPGALDDPAWRIGAQWCHRQDPECLSCAIREVCPKLIERGTAIVGV